VLDPDDDQPGPAPRPSPTLVRLSSSRAASPTGEPLALEARVRTLAEGPEEPTGTVVFRLGARLLGTAELDAEGRAVLDGVRLPTGLHALTVSYGGDARHAAATSAPLPQAVTVAAAPVVVLVAAPAADPDGVRLEAELVDPHTGRLAEDATGSVVFLAGSTTVASADLVEGHARAVVKHLPPGRLRVAFAGDTEHAPATGAYLDRAAGT
jgi:hypothetical protein